MRLRLPHAPYIANKIALDLVNCEYVDVDCQMDTLKKIAQEMLEEDIKSEMHLEEKVHALLDENEEEIEFMRLDQRQLFRMAKKKLADETGFLLSWEDRYNDLAHRIMDRMLKEELIDFSVSENRVKNIIFKAIDGYLKSFESIEEVVLEKIEHYKRKMIPGTEEYDLVFQKLYEEELKKRGFF